ncbi:TIGR04290 family methyltransferase [Falsirhodobacter deserti]|uniref:TIGR04290 family methyltransferase n=1 Tax=Falsirhodobacter deserti TaxID=1365611 RepID=UPI000FE2A409|nr:TIGR04290 family methyltransferase [Falsirhodobacter deserti]
MDFENDLQARIKALGPWFHNLSIGGIQTAPDHFLGDYPNFKWQGFRHVIPDDMHGMKVLDIGCNAGFYSLEMVRRGADRVVAIDSDPRYLAQAKLAAEVEGAKIEFRQMSVYEVADLNERFDFVIFMGVLYHLRHPLLALDLIREHVADGQMLFQSMQRGSDKVVPIAPDYDFDDWTPFEGPDVPLLYFIERDYAGDPTNWFVPNRAGMEAMLRSANFTITEHPEREVYLCRAS